MTTTIHISISIGEDIRIRSFFRQDIDRLLANLTDPAVLDFSNVRFISRSVADELCNILEDYPSISVQSMNGDVGKMYAVVDRGRKMPRKYEELNARVVHLKTIEDMNEFLSAF